MDTNEQRLFMSFFSGYVDAEGYINVSRKGMEVQTQEKGIIFGSWRLLNKFGINCNMPLLSKKAGYVDKRGIQIKLLEVVFIQKKRAQKFPRRIRKKP